MPKASASCAPTSGGDDLYLSPAEMRKVLHGDRVLASVVGVDRRGRRQGAIVEVLERRSPRLVGRVVERERRRCWSRRTTAACTRTC